MLLGLAIRQHLCKTTCFPSSGYYDLEYVSVRTPWYFTFESLNTAKGALFLVGPHRTSIINAGHDDADGVPFLWSSDTSSSWLVEFPVSETLRRAQSIEVLTTKDHVDLRDGPFLVFSNSPGIYCAHNVLLAMQAVLLSDICDVIANVEANSEHVEWNNQFWQLLLKEKDIPRCPHFTIALDPETMARRLFAGMFLPCNYELGGEVVSGIIELREERLPSQWSAVLYTSHAAPPKGAILTRTLSWQGISEAGEPDEGPLPKGVHKEAACPNPAPTANTRTISSVIGKVID